MRMMIAAVALLAASPAIAGEPDTFASSNAPEQIALCLAGSLNGTTKVKRKDDGLIEVHRKNAFGVSVAKWLIRADSNGGSTIELRTQLGLGLTTGRDKAVACFQPGA